MNWIDHQVEPLSWPSDVPKESLVHSLQPPSIEVPVPTAYRVCREARSLVERWINKNKFEWYYRANTKNHVLIRTFDADRDLLYVAPYRWNSFIRHLSNSDDAEQRARVAHAMASIKHLALSALVAYYDLSMVVNFLPLAKNLETIYVIWDEVPRNYIGRNSVVDVREPVQRRWEIASYPKPKDIVHIHHPKPNGRRGILEEGVLEDGVLEEWLDDMDDRFMTTEVDPEIMDEDGEQLRSPRINVTVKDVASWF
ncbi:hypothetical protein ACHAPJ_005987 [Fusarium lateritium]